MRYRVLNSLATDEIELPKYQVPEASSEDGFYLVEVTQIQMYDLGNLGQIVHYILYDRSLKIAVDITSDVCGAPLLSRTPPVEPITEESVTLIEKFLTGELNESHLVTDEKGELNSFPSVSAFRARELDPSSCHEIRSHIATVVETRKTLDEAVKRTQLDIGSLQASAILPKEQERDNSTVRTKRSRKNVAD